MPTPRGPLSAWVAQFLDGNPAPTYAPAPRTEILQDPDAQLALWMLYEVHYRGIGVADLEWEPELIAVRRRLEARFERELRAATADVSRGTHEDVGDALLELAAGGEGPSVASFLQREATREQMTDYLRERSIAQLKESDPQSFVLPRLDGAAKAALAELQYDEYGSGRADRLHATVYARTMAAVGLDATYGAYIDDVSPQTLAHANAMSLFALNRRLRGAAMGHLAVFEATSSVPCRKISSGLARLGFPEAVTAYFDEHVVADAVHEHLAAHDICGAMVAAEPDLRTDVLFGGAACLYLDGLVGATLLQRWSADLQVAS
jgi:pyrroloquinoline quinone (PQQ) biosynthesis protein C